MAMSGSTGQVFQPLGGLRNRENQMGLNTMAVFNNISRPLLVIGGGVLFTVVLMRWYKRRG
jgi:hypothetical protein